VKKEK
jgi:hypothetical protein